MNVSFYTKQYAAADLPDTAFLRYKTRQDYADSYDTNTTNTVAEYEKQ